ncbi:hypothetical protein EPO14_03295 [Patescibacteria group bacterium]|nr:MAG: hypothetical protein EPO14_03295 [Patescibacteria group bacterium]
MDTNETTQTPHPTSTPPAGIPKKSAMAVGPIAVIVIIVGILAAGAWYFLNQNLEKLSANAPAGTVEELQASNDPDVQGALSQSSSDELDSIQADVSATDFSGIENSAAAINAGAN